MSIENTAIKSDPFPAINSAPGEDDEILKRALKASGLYGLGEACIRGEIGTEGIEDLVCNLIERPELLPSKFDWRVLVTVFSSLLFDLQRGKRAYLVADRHYNLGNDLFSAMLDESMSYTCGNWQGANSLEEAQLNKLGILCHKLGLKPGMQVLDIGCGWGNFASYAAKRFGVSVVGLTVSKEQAKFAREQCQGLPVEILIQDYRTFHGSFDRIVSIEMIEAVGRKNMGAYFRTVHRCLNDSGLFALQAISAESFSYHSSPALDQYLLWLMRHIFPNGYLPDLKHLTKPASDLFVIEDLENISFDYWRTLNSWRDNFESAWPTLASKYGEDFRRMWLYYLGGCAAFFKKRVVQLYQVIYSKGGIPGGYQRPRTLFLAK